MNCLSGVFVNMQATALHISPSALGKYLFTAALSACMQSTINLQYHLHILGVAHSDYIYIFFEVSLTSSSAEVMTRLRLSGSSQASFK